MSRIESRLKELGFILPPLMREPDGLPLPFPWINVRGDRAFISGHGPQNADGSMAGPFGKVGDLDRIAGWGRVFGMVNSAPGFDRQPR